MTMDKSAIEHIQQTANIETMLKAANEINGEIPLFATPNGFELKSLEHYMPNASRYRNRFNTTSIEAFVEYCKKFDQEGATCFVDSEDMKAEAILDMGTKEKPLHKQHNATVALQKTAAYKALLRVNGEPLSQKSAGDFVEDWEDQIRVFNKNGDPMTVAQASKAFRDMTIESARNVSSKVDDFGGSMSAMESIEAKNQDMIPAVIQFTCNPYNGLCERPFKVRVSILTGGSRPEITFRIIQLESIQEDMAKEFEADLAEAFAESKLETFIGSAN